MKSKTLTIIIAAPLFLVVLFVGGGYSQSCGLSIEVNSGESETIVKGVTATAVNRQSSRLYKSAFRQGLPYFADLPAGEYRVTVKKAGFKQTVDLVSHSCENAEDGIDAAYMSVWPGESDQEVDLTKPGSDGRRQGRLVVVSGGTVVQTRSGDRSVDSSSNAPIQKTISGGVLNGKANNLPAPEYPAAARAVRASGSVSVQVLIDYDGSVVSASAVSGHPLLRSAAEEAARAATFSPTLLAGHPVKVSGIITYNFNP